MQQRVSRNFGLSMFYCVPEDN